MRWGVAVLLLLSACGDGPSSVGPVEDAPVPMAIEAPEVRALDVLFAGCRDVRVDPSSARVCEYEPGAELRLWAPLDSATPTTLTIDGRPIEVEPIAVEEGLRWEIPLPTGKRSLELRADLDGAVGRFSLALDSSPRPWPPALEEIARIDDLKRALAELDALLPEFEGDAEAAALLLRADLVNLTQDGAALTEAYALAYEAARAHGWRWQAATMAHRLAYGCLYPVPNEVCAEAWLERARPLVVGIPQMQIRYTNYLGILADIRGDHRGALTAFNDALHRARALGLQEEAAAALVEIMLRVGRVGAWERANVLEARALELVGDPTLRSSTRGQVLNAVAWMWIEARARGLAGEKDPVPLLLQAREQLISNQDENSRASQHELLLNLAYVAVLDGQVTEARRWLEQSEVNALPREEQLWRTLLQSRVALLEGDWEKAEHDLGVIMGEADRRADIELRWQALLGLADILEARGRTEAALAGYAAAEQLLDEQLPRIAMGEGRARFIAERDRGTQRIFALLLQQNRLDEALCVARLGRTRALRSIAGQRRRLAHATAAQKLALARYRETRTRLEVDYDSSFSLPGRAQRKRQAELSAQKRANEQTLDRLLHELDPGVNAAPGCDELSRPPAGVLDLHFMQVQDGWVGLSMDATGIDVHVLGRLPISEGESEDERARMSRALLGPFAEAIRRASALRVMPTSDLVRVPFHALPLPFDHDRVLIEHGPVLYGLDLPGRNVEASAAAERVALVVAPPSALRNATEETDIVSSRLRSVGFSVQRIEGDDATGEHVRQAMPSAGFMHYVGHANTDEIGGWSSALSLARDGTVDVNDVLALTRAPRTVVLNGCETGRTDPQALAGGMSLAHAFVLAGSDLVVASDAEVDDAAAAAFVEALYDAMAKGESAPDALRTALLRRREHDDGWVHIRGWGP